MINVSLCSRYPPQNTSGRWQSIFSTLLLGLAFALSPFGSASPLDSLDSVSIIPLPDADSRFMDQQRDSINALARRHLGMQLRRESGNDLDILQKLLDQHLVKAHQTAELQAMGIVLGDLYAMELGVHWVIFRDKQGRSRALQWDNHQQVLFPVTMISRRVSAGIRVNVTQIYQKGRSILSSIIHDKNHSAVRMPAAW